LEEFHEVHADVLFAIDLGTLLLQLMPREPEVQGLLALMLHCEARRDARRSESGAYVPLSEQDVARWSGATIQEAERLLGNAAQFGRIGRFQLEAAIQFWSCFGDSRLSRRLNLTELSQHSQGVKDTPVCGNLACIVEAEDVRSVDFELLSRWGHAQKRAMVGPGCRNEKRSAVLVGDGELDLKMKIGECLDKGAKHPLEPLMPIGHSRGKAIVLIVDAAGGQIAIAQIEVAGVDDFLDELLRILDVSLSDICGLHRRVPPDGLERSTSSFTTMTTLRKLLRHRGNDFFKTAS
jgi:hypothetical protein